jgi:hypothetical protein
LLGALLAHVAACGNATPPPAGSGGGSAPGSGGRGAGAGGGSGGAAPGGADTGDVAQPNDAAGPDSGDVTPMACAPAASAVGDPAWTSTVRVTEGASYCVNWSQARESLKAELAVKARLRLTPGTYRLPDAPGMAPFALPFCLTRSASATPVAAGTGTIQLATSTVPFIGLVAQYTFNQPAGGGQLRADFSALGASGPPFALLIDGAPPTGESKTGELTVSYCPPEGCAPGRTAYFEPCDFSRALVETVTFAGGTITLERHRGFAPGGIHDPVAFVRAHGTHAGVAFDQRDYDRLVFSALHHLANPKFAVLFDAPIAGACGLEIDFSDAVLGTPPSAVAAFTIDCALDRIAPLANATFVRP